jgi:hypothetical protein
MKLRRLLQDSPFAKQTSTIAAGNAMRRQQRSIRRAGWLQQLRQIFCRAVAPFSPLPFSPLPFSPLLVIRVAPAGDLFIPLYARACNAAALMVSSSGGAAISRRLRPVSLFASIRTGATCSSAACFCKRSLIPGSPLLPSNPFRRTRMARRPEKNRLALFAIRISTHNRNAACSNVVAPHQPCSQFSSTPFFVLP